MQDERRGAELSADDLGGERAGEIQASGMGGQGEFAKGFEVREIERESMGLTETPEDSALEGDGLGLKRRDGDGGRLGDCGIRSGGKSGEERGDEFFEECVLGRGDFGGFAEGFAETGVVVALQRGEELATDTIAQEARIEIGGVLTEGLVERVQVTLDLLTRGGEQRTDESGRGGEGVVGGIVVGRMGFGGGEFGEREGAVDSGEAAGAGAAKEAQENGFGLVVAGVGRGYGIEGKRGGGALEKGVAGAASGGFEREVEKGGERCDILSFDLAVKSELGGDIAHEIRIGVGVRSAQTVIEVENDEDDAEGGGEFGEGAQERHGISSATDSHADALAGMEEAMLAHGVFEGLEHGNIIAEVRRQAAPWERIEARLIQRYFRRY